MTVATIVLSLSLIPLSSGPGMEIMKPIAAPSIGGMVTSTLHVLFMTPCLFVITEDVQRYWSHRRRRAQGGRGCAAHWSAPRPTCHDPPVRSVRIAAGILDRRCGLSTGATSRRTRRPPKATAAVTPDPSTDMVYMCPMDKDIRAHAPGKCPRCGMALVDEHPGAGGVSPRRLASSPAPAPGSPVSLTFDVFDPWKGNPVTKFSVIHERLFHAFIVSRDLQFFRARPSRVERRRRSPTT